MAFKVSKVFFMALHDQIDWTIATLALHNGTTCMWCGEEFTTDVLEQHEEQCSGS